MDFLNTGYARISEIAKSMTPAARVAAVVSLALVAIGVAWLFREHAAVPDAYLMAGEMFSAAQLRDMESAFGKANLTEYQIDGARIRVPRSQQARYMAALAEAGALPADFGEYLRKTVNASSLLLYGPRQEAQIKVAIQSELQGLICSFQGIERSSVLIAEDTSRGFPQTKTVTASVTVEPSRHHTVDERTASTIRCIVAGAWPGLKPEAVTVVDSSGPRLFTGALAEWEPASGSDADQRKKLENDWQEKVSRALGVPGAVVTANAEPSADGAAAQRISIAVAVPRTYYEQILRQRHSLPAGTLSPEAEADALAALEATETRKIKQSIAALLGTIDESSQIAVSTMYPLAASPIAEGGSQEQALAWLAENWRTLAIVGLVLLGLLVFRSTVRSVARGMAARSEADLDVPNPLFLVTDEEREPVLAGAGPPSAEPGEADALRAELADMVRRDPQAAASVLRTWIGNAS